MCVPMYKLCINKFVNYNLYIFVFIVLLSYYNYYNEKNNSKIIKID